jgi:chromosome partitioning protein
VKHFYKKTIFFFDLSSFCVIILVIKRILSHKQHKGEKIVGKTIAIVNQKGGVGKTTTAVNLSAALGAQGYKVLLVDIDPQGNATSGLGIEKRGLAKSVYDLLINETPAAEIITGTAYQNVWLLPSSMDLAGAEMELHDVTEKREFRLKTALLPVKDSFNFIFLDCPPSLGLITLNSLTASDTFLVPIQCEYYALMGLSQLMSTVRKVTRMYNPLIELEGVLLTMYDGRLNLTTQVVDEVKKYFPKKVYASVIPRNVRLSEAPSYGQPVMYYDKNSKGSAAYNTFAGEFLRLNGNK